MNLALEPAVSFIAAGRVMMRVMVLIKQWFPILMMFYTAAAHCSAGDVVLFALAALWVIVRKPEQPDVSLGR